MNVENTKQCVACGIDPDIFGTLRLAFPHATDYTTLTLNYSHVIGWHLGVDRVQISPVLVTSIHIRFRVSGDVLIGATRKY